MVKSKDIMTKNVVTIAEGKTAIEAAKLMLSKNVSSLLVMRNSKPVAIVTENDIIKGSVSKNKKINALKVKDVMNKNYKEVSEETGYNDILGMLKHENIKRFPVIKNEKLTGLITETDIVDATRNFTRMHQIVQEIILAIFGLVTAFFLFFFSPLGAAIFRS